MKVIRKFILWALLSLILQSCILFALEQTIFKNTSEFKSGNLELKKDKTLEVNAKIPSGVQNTAISYDGSYLTYVQNGKLYVENTENGEQKEVVPEDNGDIIYHKWLSDRARIVIVEKAEVKGEEVLQLLTYNPKDNSQIIVKKICNYAENMEVKKISASVLTGVYYIDIYKGESKNILYRIDRNEDLKRVTLRASILGNMEVIPREDRLVYEDETDNHFYITNPSNRLQFDSNENLALLGINKEGNIFVGVLDGEKVSKIMYGKADEDTSQWKTKELEDVVNKNDVYFNENNEIIINHNLEGKVKNLMTGKEIEYDGKLVEIKENFVATVDGEGNLQYTYLNKNSDK